MGLMKLLLILSALFFQAGLFAKSYNSKTLKTKDYEEMRAILNEYVRSSQSSISQGEGDDIAVLKLKKALKILLMRPDTDAIKSSLIVILQNEIIQYRSFMSVLQEVVEEALNGLKSKQSRFAYQASLLYIVENALSYLQSINNKESNATLNSIKQAKLKISKGLYNYLLLEMGRGRTASPSRLADKILRARLKELKEQERKRAKEEKKAMKVKKKKRRPSAIKTEDQNENTIKPNVKIDL